MKISVSILNAKDKKETIKILNNTDISYFHIDVMDGNFVKQISIPVEETLELSKVSEKKLDIHLMHSRPLSYIEQIKDLKNIEYITIHLEIEENIQNILNKITVDYYGVATPINQIAGISVPEPRMILIQPWDISMLKEIEKAINIAEIGINPNNDGKVIRLAFPELTEERRKDLVKDIRKIAEESKVAIRAIRRDGMDMAKTAQKNNEMTQDDLTAAETKIQKMTDTKIAEIDELLAKKEKEIMTV